MATRLTLGLDLWVAARTARFDVLDGFVLFTFGVNTGSAGLAIATGKPALPRGPVGRSPPKREVLSRVELGGESRSEPCIRNSSR